MSTETHVYFRGKLPSTAALSREMKALRFPFAIKPARGSLEGQSGFMPMTLKHDETGVEFDVFAAADSPAKGVDPSFDRVASFRWGGDTEEMLAGVCAAAALANLVGGVVFDEAEDKLLSVDEAIDVARKNLEALSAPAAKGKPRGTRPADIRHYLKPLLELRDDLVLIDRMLVVRPVRHLLRGAFFDRTGDKYDFRIWRYMKPFASDSRGLGYGRDIHNTLWNVYEPHFQPLLLDCLAKDFFADLGSVTTFDGFARWLEGSDDGHPPYGMRVHALLLAGHRDRALTLIEEVERTEADGPYWPRWAKEQRTFLEKDDGEICAIYRAAEAKAAKELKLGDVWEPSPFPVELPEAERSRCADPLFATDPWVPAPPWLAQELPERPGEVRFAKEWLRRGDGIALAVALTPEQAEELHRTRQEYVLCTRLSGGQLLVLHQWTHFSPHHPVQHPDPDHVPWREFHALIFGSTGVIRAEFGEDFHDRRLFKMSDVDVANRDRGIGVWSAFYYPWNEEVSIRDSRPGGDRLRRRPVTAADLSLCTISPPPQFGEYEEIVERIWRCLEIEGYGAFA